MLLNKLLEEFFKGIKKINEKNWRTEEVKCLTCGHKWKCTFPRTRHGETKLECPKCHSRNSAVIYKFN